MSIGRQKGVLTLDAAMMMGFIVVAGVLFITSILNIGKSYVRATEVNIDAETVYKAAVQYNAREVLKHTSGCFYVAPAPSVLSLKSNGFLNSNYVQSNEYNTSISYTVTNGQIKTLSKVNVVFNFKNQKELNRVLKYLKSSGINNSSVTYSFSVPSPKVDVRWLNNSGCYVK